MLHYLVGQTQAERGGRIHYFGRQRVAAHLALTQGALNVRANHRRRQANIDFR
ncbi:hypothetical protein HAALTHF_34040n [Vreelandella aquamarina]|nr:hypothetical protein HAALTHF_34040n [Halomonas axialensis]